MKSCFMFRKKKKKICWTPSDKKQIWSMLHGLIQAKVEPKHNGLIEVKPNMI